jgi:hypothetical protein
LHLGALAPDFDADELNVPSALSMQVARFLGARLAPDAAERHIFYTGRPAPLAIGQQLNPTMYPAIQLYEYRHKETPKYKPCIRLWGVAARLAEGDEVKVTIVFTSERGAPFTTAGFARMVERAGEAAELGFKAHPQCCAIPVALRRPIRATIRGRCTPILGITTSSTRFALLSCRRIGSKTFGVRRISRDTLNFVSAHASQIILHVIYALK